MIVEPDFPDHWKTRLLVSLTTDESSPLWILRLWGHCQMRKTHIFEHLPPLVLKAICKANGRAEQIDSWLNEAGFIRTEGTKVIIHQWDQYNASLVKNWENGKLGGRPKLESEPKNNPTITQEKPNDNPTITQSKPIEEIEKIEKNDKKKEAVLEVVELWNKTTLPKCLEVSPKRIASINQRLSEEFFSKNWRAAIDKAKASSFCAGKNARNWRADIDWFSQPDSVTKIMEGKYDDKHPSKPVGDSHFAKEIGLA